MKHAFAHVLILGLAACGDKPATVAAVAALPKAVAAPVERAMPDADQELARRVRRAMEEAKLHGIDVVVSGGIATLWGTTASAREKSRAAEIARNVEGVEAVENRLEVVAGS